MDVVSSTIVLLNDTPKIISFGTALNHTSPNTSHERPRIWPLPGIWKVSICFNGNIIELWWKFSATFGASFGGRRSAMPPKVHKDQLLKFADDVTQRMADWQHKKDAACSDRVNEVLLKSVSQSICVS